MSNTLSQLYGNYQSQIMPQYAQTVFQGLSGVADIVNLVPGCKNNHCEDYTGQREVVKAAVQAADVVIVSLGTGKRSDNNPFSQTYERDLKDAVCILLWMYSKQEAW